MAKIHTLTYNGTKSSDLGVFVSGSGSFDAAELDVDKYEIPGRNGDLILSNNRYKNIEITYPAFIPKAFMDKVQNVRNWMRSSKVYARLEDTYDMDHYRLGIPTGVQSFSPENRNDGANFEMTFDCKPQRFLKVGETPETVEADVQTETGEIVTFETGAESPITSAEVSLSPIQSGSGDPSPTNIRPISGHTGSDLWNDPVYGAPIVWNQLADMELIQYGTHYMEMWASDIVISESKVTITTNRAYGEMGFNFVFPTLTKNNHIYLCLMLFDSASFSVTNGSFTLLSNWTSTGYTSFLWNGPGLYVKIFSGTGDGVASQTQRLAVRLFGQCVSGDSFSFGGAMLCDLTEMFGAGNEPATVEEFRALFPLDYYAYNAGEATCVSAVNGGEYRHYTVTFTDQGTVYGGTYDFATGKLTVTHKSMLGSEATWSMSQGVAYCTPSPTKKAGMVNFYCSAYEVTNVYWSNLTNGKTCGYTNNNIFVKNDAWSSATDAAADLASVQFVYELDTPLEYTLSAQQIETLLGENNVWSDAGPITLTYAEPYTIENPTLFDARPLFTVTNPAEGDVLMVNSQAITFVDGYSGTVYIDCETMNAFSGAANLNSIIQATDFPVLVPGTNIVTWTGAGECTMTPRWWEL